MTSPEPQRVEGAKPPEIAQLLDDYRHRQDALRQQTDEAARLLGQVLAAADREGAAIVSRACAQVGRIITTARRDLIGLRAQLEAIGKSDDFDSADGISHLRDRFIDRHRELCKLFDDAHAYLEALEKDAPVSRPLAPPPSSAGPGAIAGTSPTSPEPPRLAKLPVAQSTTADRPIQSELAEGGIESARPRSSPAPALAVALFSGIAVVAVLGTLWWAVRGNVRPSPTRAAAAATIAGEPRPATANDHSNVGRIYAAGERRTTTADHNAAGRVGHATARGVAANSGIRDLPDRDGEAATRHLAMKPPKVDRQPIGAVAAARRGSLASLDAVPRRSGEMPSPIVAGAGAVAVPANPVATAGTRAPDPEFDARADLTARAQRWLDAYYRGDWSRTTPLAATSVSDERTSDERLPPGLAVRRSLEGLTFQFVNDTAILSGKMIEHSEAAGEAQQRVSWISQMWTRDSGRWRLMDVRIMSERRVK